MELFENTLNLIIWLNIIVAYTQRKKEVQNETKQINNPHTF